MEKDRLKRRLSIIKDTSHLWGSTIAEMVLAVIRGLFIPGWLGPAFYGVIGTLNLTVHYSRHLDLGVNTAMTREIPQSIEKKDDDRVTGYATATLAFNLITTLILSLGMLIFAFAVKERYGLEFFWGIIAYIFIITFTRFDTFFQLYFKSIYKFNRAGLGTLIRAAISFCLVVPLTYYYHFYGFLVGTVISLLIVVIYFFLSARLPITIIPKWEYLKPLLKTGLPLFGVSLGGLILMSVDRIIVANFLGATNMGYYSLAVLAMTFIYMLPLLAGQAMATRIYGIPRDGDLSHYNDFIIKPTLLMTTGVSVIGGIAVIALIPIVTVFLPAYYPIPPILAALLVGNTCLGGANAAGYILLALKKFKQFAFAQLVSVLLVLIIIPIMIYFNLGLAGIAMGSSIGLMLYATLLQIMANKITGRVPKEIFVSLLYLLVPPAFIAVCLGISFLSIDFLLLFIDVIKNEIAKDLLYFSVRISIFIVLIIPILIYVETKISFVKTLWIAIREKFGNFGGNAKNGSNG